VVNAYIVRANVTVNVNNAAITTKEAPFS